MGETRVINSPTWRYDLGDKAWTPDKYVDGRGNSFHNTCELCWAGFGWVNKSYRFKHHCRFCGRLMHDMCPAGALGDYSETLNCGAYWYTITNDLSKTKRRCCWKCHESGLLTQMTRGWYPATLVQ